jgi:hypothetical protein
MWDEGADSSSTWDDVANQRAPDSRSRTGKPIPGASDMSAIVYEIHVLGAVDESSLAELGDIEVSKQPAKTVLAGGVADQAELLGLLSRLRSHGLVITELHRRRERGRSSDPQ